MKYFKPYKYIKDESSDPIYKSYDREFLFRSRIYPFLYVFIGLVLFGSQVVYPFISIKTTSAISKSASSSVLGAAAGFNYFEFTELNKPQKPEDNFNVPKYFLLTIKKLGIINAQVETNSPHLNPDDALGHYAGSGLPGEVGNAFIYGHSALPVFYNPTNYKTIFSTIDKLEPGDEIVISYNNNEYTYVVEGRRIMKPYEVNPLAEIKPRYLNESTLILMTCAPAGSKTLRLLVSAVLQKDNL